MMKRWLPAPLLSLALMALWLLLVRSIAWGHVLLAALLALLLPALLAPLRPAMPRIRNPRAIARLLAAVGWDVLLSNIYVLETILDPHGEAIVGQFVFVPLDLHDPSALAALSTICAVIPGSIWCEMAPDGSAVLLHVWDHRNPDKFVADFKSRYERPLQEIFE
ncbi:MAG: Na+/H+ antiporter subunit E [Burkholderiaceae bacterium]|jgi:multicomponent K+:H+ antiporter subunit E|nr:Na+/H+ antiporter subunit E [Burkholderiaceae bacterium]